MQEPGEVPTPETSIGEAAAPPIDPVLAGEEGERTALVRGEHADPHRYLGPHPARRGEEDGVVVRVRHREAVGAELVLPDGTAVAMAEVGDGVFAVWQAAAPRAAAAAEAWPLLDYRLRFTFADGSCWERDDPYRYPPNLGDVDLYLLSEGTHLRLWECLGARQVERCGVAGTAFSVWAPNALRVSVVGDFCHWDGRLFPMRRLGSSGVFDLFLPGIGPGEIYKYEVVTGAGLPLLKADPLAACAEVPPGTASRTFRSAYAWGDGEWMQARRAPDSPHPARQPMAIYEVHLGSWLPGAETPRYREIAPRLIAHVEQLGFNYVELLPVAEHPFSGSWGYQVTGYYAPTARYGDPDDFRAFVDLCHRHGIGVILDWVPAHFVKDAHGLGRFDGTALYEHEDPRQGIHPDWDTYIFNYGRNEVRNFLVANALYWLEEFHVDGLRVDAVASMLYLDYSRKEGEWVANERGGKENLAAIDFLRRTNEAVRARCPGCFLIAEESTTWPGVTRPVAAGGLGFTFKWNMGWMHDTLAYFAVDPLFRSGRQDQLTFAMMYEHSEHFINPLSHDEVVHGKGSLYSKMPGDPWRKLANLRALFAYQMTRPGKKLLFMGSELASVREWDPDTGLDWYLLDDPGRAGLWRWLRALGALYRAHPCLWQSDPDPEGFQWIACHDKERSVISYERRTVVARADELAEPPGVERLIVVLNLTPMPREAYRIGAPEPGRYRRLLSSDEERFGGSGYPTPEEVESAATPADGCHQSLVLTLPPLAALVLAPAGDEAPAPEPGSGKRRGGRARVKR